MRRGALWIKHPSRCAPSAAPQVSCQHKLYGLYKHPDFRLALKAWAQPDRQYSMLYTGVVYSCSVQVCSSCGWHNRAAFLALPDCGGLVCRLVLTGLRKAQSRALLVTAGN